MSNIYLYKKQCNDEMYTKLQHHCEWKKKWKKIEIEIETWKSKNRNKKSINRKNRRKNRNSGEDCYRIVCLIAISLNQHCMN